MTTNYRDTVKFKGIQDTPVTYKADGVTIVYDKTKAGGSAAYGLAATISGNGTVALTADGEKVIGKVGVCESDGKVTIHKGFQELPAGDGATVTAGFPIVGDLGPSSAKGYIRNIVKATLADVVEGIGTMVVDATTTSKTVVLIP